MRSSADASGTGCCGIAMLTSPKSRGSWGIEGVVFHEKKDGEQKQAPRSLTKQKLVLLAVLRLYIRCAHDVH